MFQCTENLIRGFHAIGDRVTLVCKQNDPHAFRRYKRGVRSEAAGRTGFIEPNVRVRWLHRADCLHRCRMKDEVIRISIFKR